MSATPAAIQIMTDALTAEVLSILKLPNAQLTTERAIESVLSRYYGAIAAAISQAVDAAIPNVPTETDLFTAIQPVVDTEAIVAEVSTLLAAGDLAARQDIVDDTGSDTVLPSVPDILLVTAMGTIVSDVLSNSRATLASRAVDAVRAAANTGLTNSATSSAVRAATAATAASQASGIATNLTTPIINEARTNQMAVEGWQYHRWQTIGDNRVRPSHTGNSGYIVRMGDPFPNGQRFPGDRTQPIEQWINCRCGTEQIAPPAGKTAPLGVGYWRAGQWT